MEKKPICEFIESSLVNGELPGMGMIQSNYGEAAVSGVRVGFADGAPDGIARYHTFPPRFTKEDDEEIKAAIKLALSGKTEEADMAFKKIHTEFQSIHLIDAIQDLVQEVAEPGSKELLDYACHCAFESDSIELVKTGLIIMELYASELEKSEEYRHRITTLGLADEFTIYVVFIIRNWKNGNNRVFNLVKKVHGWGRIHTIEQLKNDTDEIKHWLLTDAVDNTIMNEYSCLPCWFKSGAADKLSEEMTREEFTGVRKIIAALLEYGPGGRSIYDIEDPKGSLKNFLDQADRFELNDDDKKVVESAEAFLDGRPCKSDITVVDVGDLEETEE